ncbi:murein biosynthesis integral membrane protein MurJ [Candidatus Babeliales bacterium]|nr:murein biosynthesis integral membrane protein MurJ [Candidatus Babeliales bacterium]
MSSYLDKKSILKKTFQFGWVTLLSRILGIFREILQVRFLGIGAISDAFIMAFKIPHFLRRIFAEGALSVSFVPVYIRKIKNGELKNGDGLMSLSFLFFEGIVFFLCLIVVIYPNFVLKIIAPGFSQDQLTYAVPFLRVLFPIIFFISSSALFGGALNAVNHFFVPAFGPVLMNIFYVLTLILCLNFKLSVSFLCGGILFSGFAMFVMHAIAYYRYNFSFSWFDGQSIKAFKLVLRKFLPSLIGVSIIEINLFVDVILASFLPKGSVSLIYYSGRFVNIPIGVFAVGFATVLLPQFSRFATYAKKRFNFYILEVTKFVSFLIIPAMFFSMFIAERFFRLVLLKNKATAYDLWTVKWLFIIYATALVFLCLNKVLVNVFYSLHDTISPTKALAIATVINFVCNVIGMKIWGAFGIVGSTSISSVILTFLFFIFLRRKHNFKFYFANYFNFLGRYLLLVLISAAIFLISYFTIFNYLQGTGWQHFFFESYGYWLLMFSLAAIAGAFIFFTYRLFGIRIYFLSK